MYYVCHDTFLSTAIGKDQLWLEGDQKKDKTEHFPTLQFQS